MTPTGCGLITQILCGPSLNEAEPRAGSTRRDGSHDVVVVVAVDAARRSRHSTEAVAAGHGRVFADGEAALTTTQPDERDVARGKSGIVRHDVFHLPSYGHRYSHSALVRRLPTQRNRVGAPYPAVGHHVGLDPTTMKSESLLCDAKYLFPKATPARRADMGSGCIAKIWDRTQSDLMNSSIAASSFSVDFRRSSQAVNHGNWGASAVDRNLIRIR